MSWVRVLLTAMRSEKGALAENLASHAETLAEAAAARCDLAVFPELSLTGSVDARDPDAGIGLDDPAVAALVEATYRIGVGAIFGLAERTERPGGPCFITQAYALAGELLGVYRKRHLGEGEEAFTPGSETMRFEVGRARARRPEAIEVGGRPL